MLDNPMIKKYTIFNEDNLISEQYIRKPHPDDVPSAVSDSGVVVPARYYGEWVKVPDADIEEMNKQILSNREKSYKKIAMNLHTLLSKEERSECAKQRHAKRLSARERADQRNHIELEKAIKLLNNKMKEKQNGQK